MTVVKLDHVTKMYGSNVGVKDVSFVVEPGAIFGFLGPNGAGKTTTISMLVDLIRPTSGKITIFGLDAQQNSTTIRKRIGFLAGDFALDENLTGWQQLEYFGNLRGGADKQKIEALAERLTCNLKRPIKTLSRGNRQKVGLISALMHNPELLIFDEPTSGLDPLVQAEFNSIILEYKAAGKTVFISSHLLSEVQEVCDQVAFIREGELIASQDMKDLAKGLPKQVHLVSNDKLLKKTLAQLPGLQVQKTALGVYDCLYQGELKPLLQLLTKYNVSDATIGDADLETVFMRYYQKDRDV